jgi:hypothetical protein
MSGLYQSGDPMNRRNLLGGLLVLPASGFVPADPSLSAPAHAQLDAGDPNRDDKGAATIQLVPSGPISSRHDGQTIENLDIHANATNAVTVLHQQVTVRNCRIRHAGGHGVRARGASGLVLTNLEIDHVGAPAYGVGPSDQRNNVDLEGCPGVIIAGVKASRGSSNIYVESSEGARLSLLELHDARGPMPRGQNVQFNQSPNSILEDFSAQNGSTSWTEDNVSVFRSDRCAVRRGLVSYNNSPTGDGIMLEGSFDCIVEDVDAVQQGNGAFAAVPQGEAGCGGCTFRRCRTRQSYNTKRDGRAAPASNGLSIYTLISAGARKHTITECHYDALANPRNLIWDVRAVNSGWSFRRQAFAPRTPIRLDFGWY